MKRLYPLLIIFAFVLLIYYPALTTYFSQDDFFHFKVSQTDGSFLGFISLFGFHPFAERGIAFYRPISRELLFNVYFPVFGLNHIPFRLFVFFVHFINIYLVYSIVQMFTKNKKLSFFVSFFFAITAANVATLYYLTGGIQTLLATTFTLSSVLFFQKYLKTNRLKFKLLSFFSFLLGISSHEQAMIIPLLITGLILISDLKRSIRRSTLELLPYFLIIALLLYLEISRIGFSSAEQQYQVILNLKTAANSMMWYSIWALGVPETLIDFVFPGLKLNPVLLRYWSKYYLIIFPSFLTAISILIIASIYLFIKKSLLFTDRFLLYNLIWFLLGLLPVILLPLHKSTHYLTISLPAFWTIAGLILFNFYQQLNRSVLSKVIISVAILSLITLSVTSALLGRTNYWAATRGGFAEKLIKEVKSTYPTLPKGAIIYFKNDPNYPFLTAEWGNSSKQASIILNGSDALQLLYNDKTLKVYYEDLIKPDNSKENIYTLVANIY